MDGRSARGVRTRSSIVEATIDLIVCGNRTPTSSQVAERAGVSVRSVFHHFGQVPVLFRSAADVHAARTRSLIGMIPPHGPLPLRAATICHQRRQLFEAVGPVLRAASAGAHDSGDGPAHMRAHLRRQLLVGLRPEILTKGGDRSGVFDALDLATGWRRWTSLRRDGRSAVEAERVLVRTITDLLR